MLSAHGRRLSSRTRARRLGWIGVVLSLLVNAVLFGALTYVNDRVEGEVDDITSNPIDVYVPPHEIDDVSEPELEPEPAPIEPETPQLEPIEMMTAPTPLLPRTPIENLSIDDVSAMSIAVADLPVAVVALQGPMELRDIDSPPTKTSGSFPPYPRWAQSRALEADLTVEFVVNADGSVSDVRVSRLEGDERFRVVAIEAVRRWRFSPGTYRGDTVPVRCFQKLSFRVDG